VEAPPVPEARIDCEELAVVLTVDPQSVWQPIWDNGETSHQTIYAPTRPQVNLRLQTAPNCEEFMTIPIPSVPNVNDIPFIQDTSIYECDSLPIQLDLNTEEWRINWEPASIVDCASCMQVNIFPVQNTDISLLLEHISGCVYESSFFIRVVPAPENFYIPNVFSPNGDSQNDEWTVFHSPNIRITGCKIFNRWGNLIYSSETDEPKWDGTSMGQDCVEGVYVYVLNYSTSKGITKIKSGDITLMK